MKPHLIGVLGASFDPVHNGHLALANLFIQQLNLTQLILMPTLPWQKTGVLETHHRLAMVHLAQKELAHSNHIDIVVSTAELDRGPPSYTVETLAILRRQIDPHTPLCLLIGMDQLLNLETWYHWQALFNYAHLCVGTRPGADLDTAPACVAAAVIQRSMSAAQLSQNPSGGILINTHLTVTCSSTYIRAHPQMSELDLPKTVWQYICQHHLYSTL